METVYIETTIPGYLTAKPGRDLVVSAHQEITREWWETAGKRFELVISEAVIVEALKGDTEAAEKREMILKELPILKINNEVRDLIAVYKKELGLPEKAFADIVHIAFAVAYEIEYLITWNCAHIANGEIIRKLYKTNEKLKRLTPVMLTPEELLETP